MARTAAKALAQAIPELEAALKDIGSAHRDGCAPGDMSKVLWLCAIVSDWHCSCLTAGESVR